MKAHLHSARIAPKKANLIAKMVRGMPVPQAVEALRCTQKKGARLIEQLLRSAMANASHNEKQDPQMMVIKTIVVNQGQAYRRGMPKARGQVRPYRKFLSHISLVLGYAEEEERKAGGEKVRKAEGEKVTTLAKQGDQPSHPSKKGIQHTLKKGKSGARSPKEQRTS